MKLILFQLFTNFTIGSKVYFDNKVCTIVDFLFITPFGNRKSFIRATLKRPFYFVAIMKNEYGGIETAGMRVIKSIFKAGLCYTEIKNKI